MNRLIITLFMVLVLIIQVVIMKITITNSNHIEKNTKTIEGIGYELGNINDTLNQWELTE